MALGNPFTRKSWSPYAVGVGIGVLSWFAFLTADHALGITTAFEYTAALSGKAIAPAAAQPDAYLAENSPKLDWEWMLVLGVFLGALLSSALSGDRTPEKVPPLWRARFGPGVTKRFIGAFVGGAIMMFGARMAQGCTSGHGISGALQLAASSWLFVAVFFPVAVATAFLLYGRRAGADV
jgi:uncharacterized protein